MRKKWILTILLLFAVAITIASMRARVGRGGLAGNKNNAGYDVKNPLSERIGEEIIYDVKLGAIYLGKSSFNYAAQMEVNGRLSNLMVFKTQVAHFVDTERIYSDPQTLLPIIVERDILNWLSKEKITEDYDQANFTVNIRKKTWLGEETESIKKGNPIQNAVLLPHYIRSIPDLNIGYNFMINLPNRSFKITLISIENITIPAGTFKAYRFESTPRQIEVWVSADARRIPLKMQGIGAYGYSLVMKEYKP